MRFVSARTDSGRSASTAAAENGVDSFADVYDANVERVYRYCYARLGSRELAEDATSQTFLKALSRLETHGGGAWSAWLVSIARNTMTDLERARRRAPEVSLDSPEAANLASKVNSRESSELTRALAGLRDDQRSAVELQLAGWTLAESAEALGKSVAAVKMLRARALAKLKQSLSDSKDGER